MKSTRLSLIIVLALAAMMAAAGCGRNRQPAPEPALQPTVQPQRQATPAPTVRPQQPVTRQESVPSNLSLATIYFDYDMSTIRDDQMSAMSRNAQLLNQYGSVRVRLEGHCDERGSDEYNMALGQRRADAIQQYLLSYGISSSRISTVSYGEMRPAVSGNNESAWSQNRRVEIVIVSR